MFLLHNDCVIDTAIQKVSSSHSDPVGEGGRGEGGTELILFCSSLQIKNFHTSQLPKINTDVR